MTAPEAGGRRLIGAGDTLSLPAMGHILRAAFPAYARQIPSRILPAPALRLLALFDRALKAAVPDIGFVPVADSAYVTELTGVAFRPAAEAVRAAARSLIEHGVL